MPTPLHDVSPQPTQPTGGPTQLSFALGVGAGLSSTAAVLGTLYYGGVFLLPALLLVLLCIACSLMAHLLTTPGDDQ